MNRLGTLAKQRAVGLVLLALCALLWFVLIPSFVPGSEQSLFPRMAVAWIAIFAVVTTLLPPVAARPRVPTDEDEVVGFDEDGGEYNSATVYGLMVIWGIYVVSLNWLGFYISTYLMLSLSMLYLGVRTPLTLLLRPALVLGLVYLLLQVALNFRLPEAFWQ